MFFSVVSLSALALALIASAGPVLQRGQSVHIPLPKRRSLTGGDGIFSHDKAIIERARVAKYAPFFIVLANVEMTMYSSLVANIVRTSSI